MNPCDHCSEEITDVLSTLSMILVSPLMRDHQHATLCGYCALELAEFLCPALLDSPEYQEEKRLTLKLMEAKRAGSDGSN